MKIDEIFDQKYISSLPEIVRFNNPTVVALCKRPELKDFRLKIERWFTNLADKEKLDIYKRLRDKDSTIHESAFWELFFNEYAINKEWVPEKNPKIDNLTPDYYIKTRDDFDFYLEIYTLGPDKDHLANRNRFENFLRKLDKTEGKFTFTVHLNSWLGDKFNSDRMVEKIKLWVSGLPEKEGEYSLEINENDASFKIYSFYNKHPLTSGHVVAHGDPCGSIDPQPKKILRKLSGKLNKYKFVKDQNKPLVLVITTDHAMFADTQIECSLFGLDTIVFSLQEDKHRPEPRTRKDFSGFFTPNPGMNWQPKNTRLSAVIIAQKKWVDDEMAYDLSVLHNPWAKNPIPESVFGTMPQYLYGEGDELGTIKMTWKNKDNLTKLH